MRIQKRAAFHFHNYSSFNYISKPLAGSWEAEFPPGNQLFGISNISQVILHHTPFNSKHIISITLFQKCNLKLKKIGIFTPNVFRFLFSTFFSYK